MKRVQLAIVGGGPAGLAAAAEAVSLGLSVALLDEQAAVGGQIYRHVEEVMEAAPRRASLLGKDYRRGAELARRFHGSGALHLERTLVWHGEPGRLWYFREGRAASLEADRILVATGAMERPVPLPGWTLPGVMTVGAAQILLKTSGILPRGRTVLVGQGPLLLLFAQQLLAAGGKLEAIIETLPADRYRRALRHVPKAVGSGYLRQGLALLLALRRQAVRFFRGAEDVRLEGDGEVGVVRFRSRSTEHSLEASHVFLHEGVVPNCQLTRLLGCEHLWDPQQHCFRPRTDQWGNTTVEGVMVAGDGAAINGALAAEEAGRLAAFETARALGRFDRAARNRLARASLARLRKQRAGRLFLDTLYAPVNALPRHPDTVVCRCEEVTAGEIRAAVAIGGTGPNQMKAYLRCGMGPCQGRMCGLTVSTIIADELGISPRNVGYFRVRPPLKPLPLEVLAEAELPPDN